MLAPIRSCACTHHCHVDLLTTYYISENFSLSQEGPGVSKRHPFFTKIGPVYVDCMMVNTSHARNVTHLVKSEFESELEKWSPPPLVSEEVESVLPIDIYIVEFDWARVRRSVFRMLARRKKHMHVDMPCLFLSDVLAVHHNNLAPLNNKVRKTNLKQLI